MDIDLQHRINAGRVALEHQIPFFRKQFGNVESSWKHDSSRVTFADFAISENIITELRTSFPSDDFCSEETLVPDELVQLHAKFAWVLDPIDGTNNYALGIPMCAISLALLCDGHPIYGFIYEYPRDLILHGSTLTGVFEGTQKITFTEPPLSNVESVLGMQFPLPNELIESYTTLLKTYRVRSIGSGTLNLTYLATGKFAGVYDHKCKVWDIAAAAALAEGNGRPLHFLGDSPFPLKSFSSRAPIVPYYAGCPEFCTLMKTLIS